MPTLTDYLLEANLFTIIIVKVGMTQVAFAMVEWLSLRGSCSSTWAKPKGEIWTGMAWNNLVNLPQGAEKCP